MSCGEIMRLLHVNTQSFLHSHQSVTSTSAPVRRACGCAWLCYGGEGNTTYHHDCCFFLIVVIDFFLDYFGSRPFRSPLSRNQEVSALGPGSTEDAGAFCVCVCCVRACVLRVSCVCVCACAVCVCVCVLVPCVCVLRVSCVCVFVCACVCGVCGVRGCFCICTFGCCNYAPTLLP